MMILNHKYSTKTKANGINCETMDNKVIEINDKNNIDKNSFYNDTKYVNIAA